MSAMHEIGRTFGLSVRQYTATPLAPFESSLSVMARTGILVSRHGPFLANAMFLPPDKDQLQSPECFLTIRPLPFCSMMLVLVAEILCFAECA